MIKVEHVRKTYKVSKRNAGFSSALKALFRKEYEYIHALDDVSFTISEGEMVGYIGPNGAGKSSTIKILSGILTPEEGICQVDGLVPWKNRIQHVKNIGVVFGQRSQLWWDVPVLDSFELLKEIYQIGPLTYRRNLDQLTDMLNLSELLKTPVRQLSLGQRMRADIVAALLHSPQIVFFDEPTIGVDVVGKETIRNFICELNARDKVTMLFTTHDMQDIEKTCKRLIIIDKGSKVYDGLLSGIRKAYGTTRHVDVEFAGDCTVPPIEYVEIKELDAPGGRKKRFIFESRKVQIDALMSSLLACYSIRDLTVSEPEIEGLIRKIYNREVAQ